MTYRQLITTCVSAAVAAVLTGWLATRVDVWALQNSIESLAREIRDLKATSQQHQQVTIGYDRASLVKDILNQKVATNGVFSSGVPVPTSTGSGDGSGTGSPECGDGAAQRRAGSERD